jgi:hypothetical protein
MNILTISPLAGHCITNPLKGHELSLMMAQGREYHADRKLRRVSAKRIDGNNSSSVSIPFHEFVLCNTLR